MAKILSEWFDIASWKKFRQSNKSIWIFLNAVIAGPSGLAQGS